MYSEGILLKAKIYIVLVQNLRNNKRERSGHLCLGNIFSPTSPNWVWKTSDFSTLWQPVTILKVLKTRQSRIRMNFEILVIQHFQFVVYPLLTVSKRHLLLTNCL